MRSFWLLLFLIFLGMHGFAPLASGVYETQNLSYEGDGNGEPLLLIEPLPVQYTTVRGDPMKFQSQYWTKSAYVGGLEKFSEHYESPQQVIVSAEARAKSGEEDYKGFVSVKKEDFGYVRLNYDQFPSYYDSYGGVYAPFQTLPSTKLNRNLKLDLRSLSLETGLTLPRLPAVRFSYDRTSKKGDKSRLTWSNVTDTVSGTITRRRVAPSWQELDERTESFWIKEDYEFKGLVVRGAQGWKSVTADSRRYEKSISYSNAVEQDRGILIYDQHPQTKIRSTQVDAEYWFWDKKAVLASTFKLNQLENSEDASIGQYNEFGAPRSWAGAGANWASPWTRPVSVADNKLYSRVLNSKLMVAPWPWLNFSAKIRAESNRRGGYSMHEKDTNSPPDGIINQTVYSGTQTKVKKLAESFSVQFKKIPRTSLYSEVELEQVKESLWQDRYWVQGQSNNFAYDTFSAATAVRRRETQWRTGGTVSLWSFLDIKSELRARRSVHNYNEYAFQAVLPPTLTVYEDLIDRSIIQTGEADAQATLKPFRWFQSSVRYQLGNSLLRNRFPDLGEVKTRYTSNTLTLNERLILRKNLSASVSFSRQNAATKTPATSLSNALALPNFTSNVSAWFINFQYQLIKSLALDFGMSYSWAKNFNNFSATSLPLGASFNRADLSAGLKWDLNSRLSLVLKYGYYRYKPSSVFDAAHYNAHAIAVSGTTQWG